jgi:hypothetical protein
MTVRDEVMSYVLERTRIDKDFVFSVPMMSKEVKRVYLHLNRIVKELVDTGYLEQVKVKKQMKYFYKQTKKNREMFENDQWGWFVKYCRDGKTK